MPKRSNRPIAQTIAVIACLTAAVIMTAPPAAHARRPHKKHRPGSIVYKLPRGHRRVHVGPSRYYYHGGIFYRKRPSGYLVVNAPIGALVLSIPIGSRAFISGGLTFYLNGSTYYRRDRRGYRVVAPPGQTVITNEILPVIPTDPVQTGTVSVTVSALNVRSGPAVGFPVINQVRRNDLLTIHGFAPDWLYVKLPAGQFGWVMLRYTSLVTPGSG